MKCFKLETTFFVFLRMFPVMEQFIHDGGLVTTFLLGCDFHFRRDMHVFIPNCTLRPFLNTICFLRYFNYELHTDVYRRILECRFTHFAPYVFHTEITKKTYIYERRE